MYMARKVLAVETGTIAPLARASSDWQMGSPPFRIPSPSILGMNNGGRARRHSSIETDEVTLRDRTLHPSRHGPHLERRKPLPHLADRGSGRHRDPGRRGH